MEKSMTSGKIIVILGPNASGKSEFAVRIAKKFNGEIISADSRQVYKGLDIGSGKVGGKWRKFSIFNPEYSGQFSKKILNSKQKNKKYFVYKDIIHYCIDFVSLKQVFTAYDFKHAAEMAVLEIQSKKKIPIICGGTGFYIDALLNNINLTQIPPDFKLRKKLEKKSCEELFLEFQKLNPERAKKIDKNNKRRLIRALEIEFLKLKDFHKPDNLLGDRYLGVAPPSLLLGGRTAKFDVLYFGIKHPPEILKQRIKKRLITRLRNGMIKEVYNLHFKQKISWKRLYNLGLEYRFISLFLRQKEKNQKSLKLSLKEKNINIKKAYNDFMLKIKTESWHYAKRQLTWFKRNKEINWIELSEYDFKKVEKMIKNFLSGKSK